MNYTSEWITYESTGSFSNLAVNYLQQHNSLKPFYKHAPTLDGIADAISEREGFNNNRKVLAATLQQQYAGIAINEKVKANIEKLLLHNTFTVCTAHQPNIFTGYLYFLYKILHTVKLAEVLNEAHPGKDFVPVYYMGSEDNDLEELNHIFINNDHLAWSTKQTGAVGRMKTKGLEVLIDQLNGQLSIFKHGPELIRVLKEVYLKSASIQEATLKFVNYLFEDYGLLVLIPDQQAFKKIMIPVFEDDLFNHTAANIVKTTAEQLSEKYHAQVNPRDINLFYMQEGIRERITKENDRFIVNNTALHFSGAELKEILHANPERFSPNVVLRGIMQETILPNIAFIGGGSEVAYWMELKGLFEHYGVPYPVLLLRNSFLIVSNEMKQLMDKLDVSVTDLFKQESVLQNEMVLKNSSKQLSLQNETDQLTEIYQRLESVSGAVDPTLVNHVKSLYAKTAKSVEALEKKILRAEKRTYETQNSQLKKLKAGLFPNNNLQERVENLLPYYARSGKEFIQLIYNNSPAIEQNFGVLIEQ